jgi:hypothetical protein
MKITKKYIYIKITKPKILHSLCVHEFRLNSPQFWKILPNFYIIKLKKKPWFIILKLNLKKK